MIVQTAPHGGPHFVMTMAQHTELAALFAAHFGNAEFATIEPHEIMLHVIGHHDAGWRELDAKALRDPATGLPYNLVETPFERIVETSSASPNFNSKHHPYCELISSMHSWGLYNGRYGMSDKVLLDGLAAENRAVADRMLDVEKSRQEALEETLRSDPETAAWVEEKHLFQNYKQLQFFDTLALYFNCTHEGERAAAGFSHVPVDAQRDVDVSIEPRGGGWYELSPYPFDRDDLQLTFRGRYLEPLGEGEDFRVQLEAVPEQTQTIRLSAAH
jgi:hypothetical protein